MLFSDRRMFHLGVQPKIQVIKVVKITTVKKQTCTRRRKCGRYKTQTVNDRQTARGIKCGQGLGYETQISITTGY